MTISNNLKRILLVSSAVLALALAGGASANANASQVNGNNANNTNVTRTATYLSARKAHRLSSYVHDPVEKVIQGRNMIANKHHKFHTDCVSFPLNHSRDYFEPDGEITSKPYEKGQVIVNRQGVKKLARTYVPAYTLKHTDNSFYIKFRNPKLTHGWIGEDNLYYVDSNAKKDAEVYQQAYDAQSHAKRTVRHGHYAHRHAYRRHSARRYYRRYATRRSRRTHRLTIAQKWVREDHDKATPVNVVYKGYLISHPKAETDPISALYEPKRSYKLAHKNYVNYLFGNGVIYKNLHSKRLEASHASVEQLARTHVPFTVLELTPTHAKIHFAHSHITGWINSNNGYVFGHKKLVNKAVRAYYRG